MPMKSAVMMASVSCLLNELAQAEKVIPAKCIEQAPVFGRTVQGAMSFDQTKEVIVDKMPVDFTPMSYNKCLNDEDQLLSFQWTYANEDRSKQYRMTRVGKQGDNCLDIDIPDAERGNFDIARMFRDDEKIVKLVLVSSETGNSSALGPKDSNDEKDYFAEEEHNIVGFWGQYTEDAITQIGMLVADLMCVDENGVDMEIKENNFDEIEEISKTKDDSETTGEDDNPTGKVESFSSRRGGDMDDEDDVDPADSEEVLLTVLLVVVATILIAILVIIITHYCTKGNAKTNKVTVLNTADGQAHNNSAIPQESEEALASQGSKRGEDKDTDRALQAKWKSSLNQNESARWVPGLYPVWSSDAV